MRRWLYLTRVALAATSAALENPDPEAQARSHSAFVDME